MAETVNPILKVLTQTLGEEFSASLILSPLERIQIILQTRLKSWEVNNNTRLEGLPDAIAQIKEKDGILGFWRTLGAEATLIILKWLSDIYLADLLDFRPSAADEGTIRTIKKIATPVLFFFVRELICYPILNIKIRLACDLNKKYSGFFNCLSKTVDEEGFTGLYSGFGFSLLASGLREGTFYYMRNDASITEVVTPKIIGARIGTLVVSHIFSYPIETIRNSYILEANQNKGLGMIEGGLKVRDDIVSRSGVTELFSGLGVAVTSGILRIGYSFAYGMMVQ